MDTTVAANGHQPETTSQRQEVSDLISDMQDLLGRVGHLADPEINLLRTRIEHGIAVAKQTLADGSSRVQRTARQALNAGDGYVRDQPWQAVGIAAAVGLAVGILVARR
jgi:ElaB/YqjD/DUF883 family membrane-anchored ribosome-binding protein